MFRLELSPGRTDEKKKHPEKWVTKTTLPMTESRFRLFVVMMGLKGGVNSLPF